MSRRVFTRPRARQDIVEHAMFIAGNEPAAAERFVDAVERSLAMLADMPGMGAPRA